ncbi:osteopetrosis-associated transmembrane protein 1 isoform X1 [Channa argus]|uniref:osteopetrosis-associated transmembrane protein 1 isoform X1 n=1 Tax=Channa argus TaxID=215402 RepID=UPI0029454401|nr:hypothetical protein Q8A73_018412 [Channa argus]
MSLYKNCLILLAINIFSPVSGDGVNGTAPDTTDKRTQSPSLSPPVVAAAELNSANIKPDLDSLFPLSLLSSFPEDPEVSDYCSELLHIFGQRYVACVSCLVPAARPVKVCQNCYSSYGSLANIYRNISGTLGPANVSCKDNLLRSDRLMLVNLLYINLEDVWSKSNCKQCITKEFQSLTNDTLYFMAMLNQTRTCFEKYPQGNHSEQCKNCNSSYKGLNELYSRMEKNQSLCIDIEDAMNMTRRQWTNFNCTVAREETVPIIAVSSFMLFLPIIFYLSSFLHSEQKKRKLIHPKRAKSYSSLTNIQDKLN